MYKDKKLECVKSRSVNNFFYDFKYLILQMNKAIVYIEQEGQLSGVTFPSTPVVVSLLDYDNVEVARELPPRGYPVVCVTVSLFLH